MKKIYIAIVCIALALFVSCDEKKAKDEITKVLDKTVDVGDKATPKPANTQGNTQGGNTPTNTEGEADSSSQGSGTPTNTEGEEAGGDTAEDTPLPPPTTTKFVVSSYRVITGQVATFTKVAGYTYALKTPTSGVTLSDVEGDTTKKQVSSTEAASGVVIIGTKDGNTIESDPIEFVLIELTKPAVSSYRVRVGEVATFPKVEGHTYTLKEAINGVTLSDVMEDTTKKQVSSTEVASGVIIFATFDGNSIDSEPIDFLLSVANKASLQSVIKNAIAEHGNNVDLNYIDTSDITDMSELFRNDTTFNGDVSKWDVSSVTDMSNMFRGATAFNRPLNNWDVSKVTDMYSMFRDAATFNQPLNNWNVSSVKDMRAMFDGATSFNQDISGWVNYSGRYTDYIFSGATAMNANPSNKPTWVK